MSITRLQQARQMYAMGQRVGRIAFGGGGSYSEQGGYQGQGDGKGGKAGGAGTGVDGQGGTGGGNPEDKNPFNTGPDPTVTNLDVREQYTLGTPVTLGKPIGAPDFTKVGPGSQYQQNIQLQNELLNTPYKFNKMPFIPYISTPVNLIGTTLGKFGYDKNTKFFSDNSIGGRINPATGKPFGYGIDGYKAYMEQRQLGNVGAYGNTEQGQNSINQRSGEGDTNQGIMNINNNVGDADGDGDVDQDDFIFNYFDKTGKTLQAGAGGVEDLMSSIRERISNLFS
jgi:hypothetical protein